VLNTVGSFLLVTWGQEYVSASYTAILIAANPLFAAIGAAVVLPDERLTRGRVLGVAVGFAGVVALFANDLGLGGETSGQNVAVGGTAILGGAAALAVVAITVRSRLSGLSPLDVALPMVLTGVVSVGCVLAALQLSGATNLRVGDGASLRGPLLAAAILGLVNAGIGNIIYHSLIRSWGVARTALVGYVVPLIGVTLGVVLLHDHLAPNMVVGLVLISASLACLGPPREPEPGLT